MKEIIIAFVFVALSVMGVWFIVRQLIRWFSGDLPAPPREDALPRYPRRIDKHMM